MIRKLSGILLTAILMMAVSFSAHAQFKEEAFSQNYSDDGQVDSVSAPLFSVKDYWRGIRHKDTLKIGTLFAGSTILVGGQQIYHKQYWKLPVIYGGLGATVGMGFYYRGQYNKSLTAYNSALELNPQAEYTVNDKAHSISNALFAGGALIYWGALLDGVITFERDKYPLPGKATLYSLLFPGLGQVYNGEYWKVPFYWGCLLGAYHFWDLYKTQFDRFHDIYLAATNTEVQYEGPISAENAKYYRDIYRRYRDYSVLSIAAFYLLQVIDANVFAYMQDFEVSDDISMDIKPTILAPDTQYAFRPYSPGLGLSVGFKF